MMNIEVGERVGSIERECTTHGRYVAERRQIAGRPLELGCPKCAAADVDQIQRDLVRDLALERRRLAKEARDALREAARKAFSPPPRYRDEDFDTFRPVCAEATAAFRLCYAYAKRFERVKRSGVGLALSGRTGTGKTHLAIAIAKTVHAAGFSVSYAVVDHLMDQLRRACRPGAEHSESEVVDAYGTVDLLIIDEIGCQRGNEYELLALSRIIGKRDANCLPTVIVSNLAVKDLIEYLGDRIVSRLGLSLARSKGSGGYAIAFDWDDYRTTAAPAASSKIA